MLEQLREKIPYFLNFHNGKKHSENDRILRVGAGLTDITYCSSAFDVGHRAFVKICFGLSKANWYYTFKSHEYLLKKDISPDICFNDKNRAIGVYFKSNQNDIPKVVERIVDIFEKFIVYFSPFTYGKQEINVSLLTV